MKIKKENKTMPEWQQPGRVLKTYWTGKDIKDDKNKCK